MKIVISGVNLTEGGPLTVYRNLLSNLTYFDDCYFYCLVNDISLFKDFDNKNITFIEKKYPKKNWLFRLFFEYIHSYNISKKLKPDIWLSLHDISTIAQAKFKYVYCHNPAPFYKPSFDDYKFSLKVVAFSKFYKYLYKFNIKSNTSIICQQEWLGKYFKELGAKDVIVARPTDEFTPLPPAPIFDNQRFDKLQLFYPALPRTFKNFTLLLKSMEILQSDGYHNVSLHLTIDNNSKEKYGKYLFKKYAHLENIYWHGILSYDKVEKLYQSCNALIFPSKLETWGLPLSEAKKYNLPIIAADLPYAHETIGYYDKVYYISPDDPSKLANELKKLANGTLLFNISNFNYSNEHKIIIGWHNLLSELIHNAKNN